MPVLTTKQQFWADHLQQADAFDGSIANYARNAGLSPKALYQWRTILKQRNASTSIDTRPTFSEVVAPTAPSTCSLTLQLGKAQLRFDALPDEAWLVRLITAHG